MPYRQSQVRADITIGTIHLGIADKWEGGEGDSDIGTYNRASGTVTLGGIPTRGDATATYLCDETFWSHWKQLDRIRGQGRATIALTPVGDDGTPFIGGAATLKGTLKTVPTPQGDFSSNDGNAIALVIAMDADAA